MPRKKKDNPDILKNQNLPDAPKTSEKSEEISLPEESEKSSKGQKSKSTSPTRDFYFGYGRRKTATARVRLYLPDKEVIIAGQKLNRGDIYVNNIPIEKYFVGPFAKAAYTEVYRTTNTIGRFITTVIASGSGKSGQLGATVLGIARTLCAVDPRFFPILRKKSLLTRDPREREREKPGLMGARKEKQSPKR